MARSTWARFKQPEYFAFISPGLSVPTDLHVDNFFLIPLIYLAYTSVDQHTIIPYDH